MIQLYNTPARKKQEFTPTNPTQVTLYTCGPTVYNYATIGNLRTYVFEDLLRRVLEYNDYEVQHVINITDVGHLTSDQDEGEDKIQKQADATRKTAWDIAREYEQTFRDDIKELGIIEPTTWCRVTDHIKEQIALISSLEKKGYTYTTSDGVYFDTSKFEAYKDFAHLDTENLEEGARVEKNNEKKNLTDFALWKFSPEDEKRDMEWDSPFGKGFPGWHIECSALSMKYLSPETFDTDGSFFPEKFTTIDIHCGGIDHIPVHHTNEVAQTEAATGKKFSNFWLHGAFLNIDNERMGKSQGNMITISTLKEKGYHPLVYRYLLLQTHYRSPMNLSWDSMNAAKSGLFRLYSAFSEVRNEEIVSISDHEYKKSFEKAINDDLNAPQALAVLWEVIKDTKISVSEKKSLLLDFDKVFGLQIEKVSGEIDTIEIPQEIIQKSLERKSAREQKDFQTADKLRDEIVESGHELKDLPDGSQAIRVTENTWKVNS